LSASASLVSLAWMIASYQKVLRDSREDKMPMSYKGAVVQILWHLFTIAARAIAFALFASVFQLYFGIFLCIYYITTLPENAALTILWFLYYDRKTTSDFDALILVCVVSSSFALGIFFMFIYYCLLHPNGPMFNPR
ncbi:PREDICTED: XK-related protein 7-like, partial [Cariama cristata]|uniref:XK-related protein 7-like n=1 Tax=Cariama cristata TaxID=54380 RepID=UPI0005206E94